ncbi:MAG: hypothetical protein DRI61_09195 [Chloroflexi bacterium]|nr:MAG: hypothetical protein DRI61_09195 [Chloroflexota bacterium]
METVNLVIVGLGKVGRALVREILSTPLKDRFPITALFDRSGGLISKAVWAACQKSKLLGEMAGSARSRSLSPLESPGLPNQDRG